MLKMNDLPASGTNKPLVEELQTILEQEIPMCAQMGMQVVGQGPEGLEVRLPLGPNRNHQQTAFAGSLSALCSIAGWCTTYLHLKKLGRTGTIVIRRSTIRYNQPVDSPKISAFCRPVSADASEYFAEMLIEKGQAKLDVTVEIPGVDRPAVVFSGSYVVIAESAS